MFKEGISGPSTRSAAEVAERQGRVPTRRRRRRRRPGSRPSVTWKPPSPSAWKEGSGDSEFTETLLAAVVDKVRPGRPPGYGEP